MKLFNQQEFDEGSRRIGFESIDCRICGEMFVPHLIWPDAPAESAGLCEQHYEEFIGEPLKAFAP